MSVQPSASPTVQNRCRDNRLFAYVLAAGASATCASAQASIVYSGDKNINVNSGFSYQVDFNGDSQLDVKFKNYVFGGGPYQGATVNFSPGKLVGFTASGLSYVTALNANDPINATTAVPSFFGSMAYGAVNPNAQFISASNKYVGLSFPIGGNTYYGWVRVDVDNAAGKLFIHDWAYQNVSGVGIAAGAVPEPTSLSFLAAGAAGLAMLRRRSSVS